MVVLGYYAIRGLVQPIRLLLAYLGIEYTEKQYQYLQTDQEWFNKDKQELGLDLPNLPYLIDGEFKITESAAIPVYLANKYNRPDLLGKSSDGSYSEREVRVHQLIGVIFDIANVLIPLCWNKEFVNVKDTVYNEKIAPILKNVLDHLGEQEFLVGSISYADFILYEISNYLKNIFPLSITPKFDAYIQRFENLKGIKQYLSKPQDYFNIYQFPTKSVWIGPGWIKQLDY